MINLNNFITEKFNNANKGDEFYTRLKDIERCMPEFGYNFKNKVVYCNCDDPSFSKFYQYFHDNFSKLGLKLLYATYYDDKPMCYEYDGNEEKKTPIESGDFRENGDIMDKCDIVVTNPPFSQDLPYQLADMCIQRKKKYIFLCKGNWFSHKKPFELYKKGKLNVGSKEVGTFDGPNSTTHVACYWFTNVPLKKDKLQLTQKYDEAKYPKYANYDAIECKNYKDIPADYDGKIGVPVSFAKYLNREQFQIIDSIAPKGKDGDPKKNYFQRLIIKLK